MRGHVRELNELFLEDVLLDHAIHPRNRRKMEEAIAQAEGNNPLCGDCCTVYLLTSDGIIQDIGFDGTGCAILLASASLMTLAVNGKRVVEAQAVAEQFISLLTAASPPDADGLGDLTALAGVREFPGRVKCATLPWHALKSALKM